MTPETSYTLLIVDDSPEDRSAFRRFLAKDRSVAYTFEEAELGEQALARLLESNTPLPDCLLVDFNIPDMSGVEFLKELENASGALAAAGTPTLPCAVVMLTGSGDEAAAVAAMKAGAQDYLVKGALTPEALQRAVRNAVEKFDLWRRLSDSEARLRLATEASGIGTWTYDPQTNEVTTDVRYRELLGLPEAGLLDYAACLARVHEDDRERVRLAAVAARDPSGAGLYDVEYRVAPLTEDEPLRWVQSNGHVYFDPSRTRVERFVGTVLDVTGRKLIEEERARHAARQERIAETLQRSLLVFPPQGALPDLDVYVEYLAALDEAFLGGDFADAFALDKGKVALVVGDVTGKGLSAATYTAEIKFALRAFLRESSDPAEALCRLNRYLIDGQRLDIDPHHEFVALSVAVMDTTTREIRCASAGAEPPLVVRCREGGAPQAEVVEVTGPLLAINADSVYESVSVFLPGGDLFVLTTDGITEARQRRQGRRGSLLFGYERFAHAAETAVSLPSLQAVAQAIVSEAKEFADGQQSDDICLLIAR